ncbi:CapA family protein [Phytoactinopolyspora halotolerans]|uniref:ATP-grasp domain-containing protein n=1 Tax=Phytoactinopolyspora halotolerans TaxID=1981512 RepID=A0A6L9SFE1_9ACTN|nr:CapA family protein [Phytoactinopolyspora halotolerans]NEE04095.1 hypothetical protein [Phytoactinopolyspora halotolerans]
MSVATELRLDRIQTYRYRMPLKRPYGTARGLTRSATNFLVAVTAEQAGRRHTGIGECQPRHVLTGDGRRDGRAAWGFLIAAVQHVHGRTISLADPDAATSDVRALMAELNTLSREYADESNRDRAFRGTLLGIEVALLDVAAKGLDLQISELLGKKRDTISISVSTISSSTDINDVHRKVVKQQRFPMTRVKGVGDVEYNWQLLENVYNANTSVGRDKPIWIDINEAYDVPVSRTFLDGVVERMADQRLPRAIVVEGMLPKADVTELPALQRHADEACRAAAQDGSLDLRIMPDEGMWDVTDLATVNDRGGCRALNIKAPKAGGLLPSLDLAEAAVAADPDIHVCIGGMLGTSDITAWTLHNLARALPRLDYLTAVPPTNVEQRIADPLARYADPDGNVIADQTAPGLGTGLVLEKVRPYIEASFDTAGGEAGSRSVLVPDQITTAEPSSATKTLVFGGDTSLGDVHINGKGGPLLERLEGDPMSFFRGLQPLITDHDGLVLNLETVLATSPTSPFEGNKRFLGWDAPERAVRCLSELGVSAVGLANNHTMDFGERRLIETREHLEAAGIAVAGAGRTAADAATPLTLRLDMGGSERRVHIFVACEIQRKLRDEYQFYADERKAGVNPLSVSALGADIRALRQAEPDSLIIAFPHWGGNYQWVKERSQKANAELIKAGVDLVLGHGAHALQQCSFADGHATVYSLGNFVFNWAGRFDAYEMPPYGLVARLGLDAAGDGWNVALRLYPIASDNTKTDFQPRPVTEDEFLSLWTSLCEHDLDGSFEQRAQAARDERGYHIAYSFTTDPKWDETDAAFDSSVPRSTRRDAPARSGTSASPRVVRVETLPRDISVFSAGSTTKLLAQAVVDRDFPHEVQRVHESVRGTERPRLVLRFTVKDRTYFVRNGTIVGARPDGTPGTGIDGRAIRICKRKDIAGAVLRQHGYSVPRGMSFASSDLRGAQLYFEAMVNDAHAGMCVKPANGNKGKKIFLGIDNRKDFDAAFGSVAEEYDTVLVEEAVSGEVLRFLYIGGDVVAVRRAIPANVIGDGRSTIEQLVEAKNADLRSRGADRHTRLRLGTDELDFLRRRSMAADSVPGRGERVFLSSLSNRHAAAEIIDCTDDVDPSYRTIVENATRCIPDIAVCGADLMIGDYTAPAAPGNHYFIELNTTPGMRGHHAPNEGTPRDVAGMTIDYVAAALP